MSSKKQPVTLSKSRLMRGLQCNKSLYLTINHPELEPPVSESQQALFDQGHQVGLFAQKKYPEGTAITAPHYDFKLAVSQTEKAIKKGEKTIFEATFSEGGLRAKIDILHREKREEPWQIIEVKSSTSVKPEYLSDVAVQSLALEAAGHKYDKAFLMHINASAAAPHLENLFTQTDLTEQIKPIRKGLPGKIAELKHILTKAEAPRIDIGPHCDEPYECPFKNHCWAHIKSPSIFEIPRIGGKAWKYYQSGIVSLKDPRLVPPTSQAKRIEAVQKGKRLVDKKAIADALASWVWPLYFFDFETIAYAIPFHPGTHPYEQVPFQFSCLVQKEPEGPLEESSFLHEEATDPRAGIILKMLESLKEKGSIVAYNMGFERKCIEALANFDKERATSLLALTQRLVDPLPIFREAVYDQGFKGSFSLKNVAPTILGADHDYAKMEIANGEATQRYFLELIDPKTSASVRESHKKAMLGYCRKDTQEVAELVAWLLAETHR